MIKMLSQDEYRRLKRHASLYSPIPAQVVIDQSQKHYSKIENHKGIIFLGENAPYQYIDHLSEEGYNLFMEGLNYHEIARFLYTDYSIMSHIYQDAMHHQELANQCAKDFTQKKINDKELRHCLTQYVKTINLPLLLLTIEDGAIENSLGIEYPQTWTAIMYVRQHIVKSFMNENHHVDHQSYLIDKIMKEIMAICTYGYRFSLKKSIVYLPHYLPDSFEDIRKLAIKGRLQAQTTLQRLEIAKDILELCLPIINNTVEELIDTIIKTPQFSSLPQSLFSSQNNEIAVHFQQNDNQPKETQTKYHIDMSDEDYRRIESLEEQEEKMLKQQALKEIYNKQQDALKKKDKKLEEELENDSIEQSIINVPLQRTTPSSYGQIAMRTKNISIARSNQIARMLKRERMYSSKSITKHKKEYGRKLDQQNLYRATLDGRVFMEHKEGHKKDLCVYLLVDNSESMSGDRIMNTMKGCYELARVLQTLNIPFSISSHKAIIGQSKIQMTHIVSFQECKKRNILDRIYSMHTSGGTHEEIALEYVLKELAKYKRQRKGFVFVLSDGDTHGIPRIHQLVNLYKKEYDIDVIGIGIQTIQITETYPQHIYIQNLDTLGDSLIQKLKEIAL